MKKKSFIIAALTGLLFTTTVDSSFAQTTTNKTPKLKKAQKGAIIGAGTGAVIGGAIGKKSNNTAIGAIIGATVGGAAGAIIGNEMDKKAEELREDLGTEAKVERIGEGIRLTVGNNLLFDFGSSDLRKETLDNLRKMAETLKKDQEKTEILIEGNTDSIGSAAFNQNLSRKRAKIVSDFLIAEGVTPNRIRIVGMGESNPVATNSTDLGRQQNRRVEIAIFASDKFKKEASQTVSFR